ncbi:MAG: efflux RND transporter permease subunit [Brevinemataceae bacterium]
MSIIEISVKKPVAMSMLLLIVMFVGLYASFSLPVDFLPDIESPRITVSTTYTGAGPEEVETSVTRPLEDVLSTVEDIDTISSTSMEGNSTIRLEFKWGIDLDTAMFNVREKIDLVRDDLPEEADSPQIFKFSTDMIPVVGIVISGIDDLATAFDLAENQIKKSLEQLPGVGQVTVSGGIETEVHIELTQNRLQAYNLDAEQIARIIAANDITSAGGYVYQGSYKFGVRTDAELENLEAFRKIVVAYRHGTPIFLEDVADIYFGGNEDNPILFVANQEIADESDTKAGRGAVIIEITKSSGANTVEVEKAVQKRLKSIAQTLPSNVVFSELYNTAKDITDSMNSVTSSGIQGGLFALLVIFFYLWDWRSLIVIGLSIPTSIITTFIAMFAFGTSFNVISMAGLTLAIGMMVDSSIVVLENVFRHRAEGEGKYTASINGAKEVVLAITASTLTTMAVFAPILFVEGLMAQLFRDLVITVVVGLGASLIISVTLVPMLCSLLIKEVNLDGFDNTDDDSEFDQNSHKRFNDRILHQVDMAYKQALLWCISHKKLVVYGANALVLVLVVLLGSIMAKEYMPVSDDGRISISLTYPLGTRYEYNETLSREIMGRIRDVLGSNLQLLSLQVKETKGFFSTTAQEHKSKMNVTLIPKTERKETINQIVEKIRPILEEYPIKNRVTTGGGFSGKSGGESIQIDVRGNDLDVAQKVADQLIAVLKEMKGIVNPRDESDGGVPEISLKPDRVALARVGLLPLDLFQTIRTAFGGRVATRILSSSGSDIDVRVRVRDEDRTSIDSLLNLNIPLNDGTTVPFRTLIDARQGLGPTEIKRSDSIRVIKITAGTVGIFEKDLTGAVAAIKQQIAEKLFIPSGVQIVFKGDFEDTQESMLALFGAFFVAIFIVYALMAAQFESYIAPFVIMASVPFGAFGSMLLLMFTGHSLNMYSAIGIVILVGIVINNGIVLIDYMNQLLEKNVPVDEAAVLSGVRRIRPVCMTTLTTILGMIPMALGLGQGGETYSPLATSVIGGLFVSTLFTLLVVPTAYAGIRKRFPYVVRKD